MHVLWECPVCREELVVKFRALVGVAFKELDNIEKASFVLGCELWTENFDSFFAKAKKESKFSVRSPRSTQQQSQSSAGDPRHGTVDGGKRRRKFSHSRRVTDKSFMNDDLYESSCKTWLHPHIWACGQWYDC